MDWLDDIIESLPSEYEELAKLYLPVIKRMSKEKALEYFELLRINQEVKAHELLIAKMTTEEISEDGDKGNEILKQLNKKNSEDIALMWHIARMILTIGLNKLSA